MKEFKLNTSEQIEIIPETNVNSTVSADFGKVYMGKVSLSSCGMLVPRSFNSQAIMSGGNYRGIEIEKFLEANGPLRVPFYNPAPPMDKFDVINGVTLCIFALEKVETNKDNAPIDTPDYLTLQNPYTVRSTVKKSEFEHRIKSAGSRMTSVTEEHLVTACTNLNVKFTLSENVDFEEMVIHFLNYLLSQQFTSAVKINMFCKDHGLVFRVSEKQPFHKAFACFRVFLASICPISLGIVDGQHRMLSVITAAEMTVLNGAVPTLIPKKTPKDCPLPYYGEAFRKMNVKFVFFKAKAWFHEAVMSYSKIQNTGQRQFTMKRDSEYFGNALEGVMSKHKDELKGFRNFVFEMEHPNFTETGAGASAVFFRELVDPIRDLNEEMFQYLIGAQADKKNNNTLREMKEKGKLDKQAMKLLLKFDALQGLCSLKKTQHTVVPFNIHFDVIPFLLMSKTIAKNFSDIYQCNFVWRQEKYLLWRSGEEKNKLELKSKAMVSEFVYYGMIRPWNYLSHLLTEVIAFFVAGMTIGTAGELQAGFGFKKSNKDQKKNKDNYHQFQDRKVPPSLFMWQVEEVVDQYHFYNIDKDDSNFNHLRSSIMKPLPRPEVRKPTQFLDKKKEIARVSDYYKATVADVFPDRWNGVFDKIRKSHGVLRANRKSYLRSAVRIATLTDFSKAVKKFGMHPVTDMLMLDKDTTMKLRE